MANNIKLSALVVAHNEEKRIEACLEKLGFVDEIVVVLDKCTDKTKELASKFTSNLPEGSWDIEGDRRNHGISCSNGDWILEVDADEHVPEDLAKEIRETIENTKYDYHEIPVDNYVGITRVRFGTGASYSKAACPGLFKKDIKIWGQQRLHPALIWNAPNGKGPMLKCRLQHYVDKNISDMIKRLDSYSTARAKDLRESGKIGNFLDNIRRFFSRFIKCYFFRKGYKEGGYGFLFALFAGLYPLISFLKAKLEDDYKED
ncbi:MAG: glycosyltransferase family 2 protein [Alphaproteobacteria bacterium]|nr:glycosyltransferase family 2 protein [Alphaproteobacteria bacterium]